jgi:hypothetical protein
VTRRYTHEHPDVAEALTALDAFVRETNGRSTWRTAMNMTFSPAMPQERLPAAPYLVRMNR